MIRHRFGGFLARRILSSGENCVVSFLPRAANKDDDFISKFLLETKCSEMNDGGMVCIRFFSASNVDDDDREFGGKISTCKAEGDLSALAP